MYVWGGLALRASAAGKHALAESATAQCKVLRACRPYRAPRRPCRTVLLRMAS